MKRKETSIPMTSKQKNCNDENRIESMYAKARIHRSWIYNLRIYSKPWQAGNKMGYGTCEGGCNSETWGQLFILKSIMYSQSVNLSLQ